MGCENSTSTTRVVETHPERKSSTSTLTNEISGNHTERDTISEPCEGSGPSELAVAPDVEVKAQSAKKKAGFSNPLICAPDLNNTTSSEPLTPAFLNATTNSSRCPFHTDESEVCDGATSPTSCFSTGAFHEGVSPTENSRNRRMTEISCCTIQGFSLSMINGQGIMPRRSYVKSGTNSIANSSASGSPSRTPQQSPTRSPQQVASSTQEDGIGTLFAPPPPETNGVCPPPTSLCPPPGGGIDANSFSFVVKRSSVSSFDRTEPQPRNPSPHVQFAPQEQPSEARVQLPGTAVSSSSNNNPHAAVSSPLTRGSLLLAMLPEGMTPPHAGMAPPFALHMAAPGGELNLDATGGSGKNGEMAVGGGFESPIQAPANDDGTTTEDSRSEDSSYVSSALRSEMGAEVEEPEDPLWWMAHLDGIRAEFPESEWLADLFEYEKEMGMAEFAPSDELICRVQIWRHHCSF